MTGWLYPHLHDQTGQWRTRAEWLPHWVFFFFVFFLEANEWRNIDKVRERFGEGTTSCLPPRLSIRPILQTRLSVRARSYYRKRRQLLVGVGCQSNRPAPTARRREAHWSQLLQQLWGGTSVASRSISERQTSKMWRKSSHTPLSESRCAPEKCCGLWAMRKVAVTRQGRAIFCA